MTPLLIHTLNGMPARFNGYQLVAWAEDDGALLALPLPQIMEEQSTSRSNRAAEGFAEPGVYGRVVVNLSPYEQRSERRARRGDIWAEAPEPLRFRPWWGAS